MGTMISTTRRATEVAMRPASAHARTTLRVLWHLVRLPVLLLLVILEPVVAFLCGGLALLGVLATIFYKAIGLPHFPMWTMLALSLGLGFALLLYEALIGALED
jgi:hypothetical protein